MNKECAIPLLPLTLLLVLPACDEHPVSKPALDQRLGAIAEPDPHPWIVPENQAAPATNPDFAPDDSVVLDELDLPDGAQAQLVELPEDAGIGIIWLGGPPEIDGVPASDYSPLELSRAFGTTAGPIPGLVENHESLAAADLVPSEARDLLSFGATIDPKTATSIVNSRLCPLTAPSYWFNQRWAYYKQTCPAGTLCGSPANDNTGAASGDFYIVALASTKTALQTCNGGAPLGTSSNDTLNAQIQYYGGWGNWYTFYTSLPYGVEDGVVFSYYGVGVNQFRMRVYNANASTVSLAAAIW